MSTQPETDHDITSRVVSQAEADRYFDEQARLRPGMSGAEFIRRWHAGELDEYAHSEVIYQSMLLPLVERLEWHDLCKNTD